LRIEILDPGRTHPRGQSCTAMARQRSALTEKLKRVLTCYTVCTLLGRPRAIFDFGGRKRKKKLAIV
jgi:hypothetical protein